MFLRILFVAAFVLGWSTGQSDAANIAVSESNASILYGTWNGLINFSGDEGGGADQTVTLTLGQGSPLSAEFETDYPSHWKSRAKFQDGKLLLRAWRQWRTFTLIRKTDGNLLLEAQWHYERPQYAGGEALLQITKEK